MDLYLGDIDPLFVEEVKNFTPSLSEVSDIVDQIKNTIGTDKVIIKNINSHVMPWIVIPRKEAIDIKYALDILDELSFDQYVTNVKIYHKKSFKRDVYNLTYTDGEKLVAGIEVVPVYK